MDIIRLIYFFRIDIFANVTFHFIGTMTWTFVKLDVYLIATTLPSLCPLIQYFFKDAILERLYNKLLDHYTRAFLTKKNAESSTVNTQFNSKNSHAAIILADNGVRLAGFVKINERKAIGISRDLKKIPS